MMLRERKAGGTPAVSASWDRGQLGRALASLKVTKYPHCLLMGEAGRTPAVPGRSRAGLSLIEVLLALAIFMMSLVVIARLVDMGTDRELEARLQTRGSRLAAAKLAELESGATDLFTSTDGNFEGDDADWSWTVTAEQQSAPNLYLVTVTVSRDLKGRPFTYSLGQMVMDPAVMGTAGEAARPDPNATGGAP